MLKKFWLEKLTITILVLVYLLCMVKGVLSYNEELVSSFVYIVLFFIFYKESLHFIKKLVKKQILNILIYYEKLTYLKTKNMYKSSNLYKLLINKEFIKKNQNLIYFEKKSKEIYNFNNSRSYIQASVSSFVFNILNILNIRIWEK